LKKEGEPAPFEMVRWHLAETFGWSLEYIDSMSFQDVYEYFQIAEGKNKAMPRIKPGAKGKR